MSYGNIDYGDGIRCSYGRVQSPNTDGDSWVCCVHSSGFVGDGHNHVNYNSYGSPDRRLTDNGYFCNQYGYIAYDDYGVQYSYGKSPYTYYSHYACLVILSGDVDNYDYNYGDGSYGAQVSPVTPYDSVAFYIFPSGSVYDNGGFDNVDDASYGRIQSPVTVNSDYAWSVTSSGTFFGDGIVINSSYGMNHSIVFYGNFRAN